MCCSTRIAVSNVQGIDPPRHYQHRQAPARVLASCREAVSVIFDGDRSAERAAYTASSRS